MGRDGQDDHHSLLPSRLSSSDPQPPPDFHTDEALHMPPSYSTSPDLRNAAPSSAVQLVALSPPPALDLASKATLESPPPQPAAVVPGDRHAQAAKGDWGPMSGPVLAADEDEDVEDRPLISPLLTAVNKLPPPKGNDFELHLDEDTKRLVTTITTVILASLIGSMGLVTLLGLLHLDTEFEALAGVLATFFLLSFVGGCVWGCWLGWNQLWFARTKEALITRLPVTPLHMIKEGELVKVRGKLAYDTTRLTASYSVLEGCIYTEACLYAHCPGSDTADDHGWNLDVCEREVVDFFVIDDSTGRSIMVKAGYGASVTTKVGPRVEIETTPNDERGESPAPELERWLADRDKSLFITRGDGVERQQQLRFTEAYLRSGEDAVAVGLARRVNGTLMIVSPEDSLSFGCRYWFLCVLPFHITGIIVSNDPALMGIPLQRMPSPQPNIAHMSV